MDTVPAPVRTAAAGATSLRLNQLSKLLRRHVWTVALLGLAGGAAAYGYTRSLPKTYTASSAFTVDGERFAIPELQGAVRSDSSPDPMPWIRTEVQAITARALVSTVAYRMHLDAVPEFNPALRPPTLVQRMKALVGPLLPSGPSDAPAPGPDEAVIDAVSHALGVFQDNRSLVINVSFTSEDPRQAAGFVNALVADYVQSKAQRRVDANQGANQIMLKRIDQARTDLADIEAQMRDLRSKSELVGLRAGSVGQQQLEELTTAAARAALERSQIEVSYERASAAAKQGSSDALASVLNSPTIARLRDQEGAASRRVAELSTRYGSDYPGVRSASAELGATRRQVNEEAGRIVASLGAQVKVARDQEADVKQQLAAAQRTGVTSENNRARLEQLQQEATSRRALYQTLLERVQQTMVQPVGDKTLDVRVLSPAVPPGGPSGPNVKLASLMGAAGGALLGCLIALTRLRSVDGFDTAGELTDATGMPVLVTVPRRMARSMARGLRHGSSGPADQMEAMRLLRGRLRFAGRRERPRTVLFVPVLPGDLAATLAAAFARLAVLDGERVLLVETDLQHPKLARLLNQRGPDAGGLAQVLGGADWRDVAAPDGAAGLHLLLAEDRTSSAHRALNGPQFENLLVETRTEYDMAVLAAPHATSSEATAVMQRADIAVLVVDGRASHAAVRDAASRIGMASRNPVVAVLVPSR